MQGSKSKCVKTRFDSMKLTVIKKYAALWLGRERKPPLKFLSLLLLTRSRRGCATHNHQHPRQNPRRQDQQTHPHRARDRNPRRFPPFTRNTKSGGDGAFQISALTAGNYSLCVQAPGDQYLDPCQWNGTPTLVALTPGQAAAVRERRIDNPPQVANLPHMGWSRGFHFAPFSRRAIRSRRF